MKQSAEWNGFKRLLTMIGDVGLFNLSILLAFYWRFGVDIHCFGTIDYDLGIDDDHLHGPIFRVSTIGAGVLIPAQHFDSWCLAGVHLLHVHSLYE